MKYVRLVTFIAIFASVSSGILAVVKPESPRVFTSVATNPRNLPITVKAAAGAFHLLINSHHYYALCLQTISVFIFAHGVTPAIRHLSASPKKCLHHFDQFMVNYRAVAILMANYAAVYRHWMWVMEVMNFVVVILNIYQAVILENYRALVLAFAVGTGFCWTIKQLAKVNEASVGVLYSWERKIHKLPRDGRMFLKSCRPVSIPIGGFFHVDRGLILTVLSVVIDTSVSLIVAHA